MSRAGTMSRLGRRRAVLGSVLGSALLCSLPPADAHAQTRIGRLFSTPAQRVELDGLRNRSDGAVDTGPVVERTEREFRHGSPSGPSALAARFDGVVVRSDGHRVSWIDGVETTEGATTPTGVRISADHAPGGRLRLRLSHGQFSAVLEPGQFIDDSGRMRRAYELRSKDVADGVHGERTTDAGGGDVQGGAAASVEAQRPVSPGARSADFVPELPRGTHAGSAALDSRALDGTPDGDKMPPANGSTLQNFGT